MLSISMILTTDWILIIQIIISVYVAKYYYDYFTRKSPLPGPLPLPLIGNLHQVGLDPAKYFMDHHEKFGDMFEIWVGSKRFIVLSRASLIDQVFIPNTQSKFFSRIYIPKFQRDGMQHGILFNDDYQEWKRKRRFVVQSLMSPGFLKQFTHLTQSLFNENESHWDKKEYHIDFAKWIKCFTTDTTLHTVTRKPPYCLNTYIFGEVEHSDPIKSEEIKESVKFAHCTLTFFNTILFQVFVPDLLKDYVPGFYQLNKNYQKNTDWLNATIFNIIKKRRMEISNGEKVDSNLLDILLTLNTPYDQNPHDEGETPMTDQEIRATLLEVCMAGTDTTGNAFCYVIWQLCHHPKVLASFQKEIKEILGDDISRQITYEDLEKFIYLDAIIKESARVIPLLPFIARTSTQESNIGGKRLDTDTSFFIHIEQIQKSSDTWEESDKFIPERFLKESNNKIVKNSFIPFGGGIRICPGRHMAIVVMKTLLISLFRKYDVELVDKISKKPKYKYSVTNSCTELKVIVRPRKDIDV